MAGDQQTYLEVLQTPQTKPPDSENVLFGSASFSLDPYKIRLDLRNRKGAWLLDSDDNNIVFLHPSQSYSDDFERVVLHPDRIVADVSRLPWFDCHSVLKNPEEQQRGYDSRMFYTEVRDILAESPLRMKAKQFHTPELPYDLSVWHTGPDAETSANLIFVDAYQNKIYVGGNGLNPHGRNGGYPTREFRGSGLCLTEVTPKGLKFLVGVK